MARPVLNRLPRLNGPPETFLSTRPLRSLDRVFIVPPGGESKEQLAMKLSPSS